MADMQTTTLGRTGLTVSRAGLGGGGHARLGQSYGHSTEQSVALIKSAIDAGVNFIDTAAVYRTEEIVGQAIKSCRDGIVVSTKQTVFQRGTSPLGQSFLTAQEFTTQVEENLRRLSTDYIDIFHLHGIMSDQYDYCLNELVPALEKLRDQGKIRFIGLTERFISDTNHKMLNRALEDDIWDVIMVGFNMINPSARHTVLKKAREKNIGTLNMFAVRRALSDTNAQSEVIGELRQNGQINLSDNEAQDPLGFLTEPGVASTMMEAAYRFCRHEPGMDIILNGTGSPEHLDANIASIQMPPLPDAVQKRLRDIFGNVDSVSGN